jgi:eukaryotic-like serine/threonine-protein kinase
MATAGVNRMMLWTDLEGRELLGRWRLDSLVRPEGRTAWFTATAEGKALMLSITETLNDDEELLARLNAAAQVRHANVVTVEEALAAYVDDTPVVIAAMEPTDESLGDVLRERSLEAAEAQQVMRALVQGLAAIHAQGLVHGRMEPASVLAMGETIKLRSDCVQMGGADFGPRSAEDVRGLGRIVTQATTGRIPAGENDPLLQLLPEPMARAVRRALSGNARIAEIAALAGVVIVPAARLPDQKTTARMGPVAVPAPMPVASETPNMAPSGGGPTALPANADAKPQESADASVAPPPKPPAKVIALLAAGLRTELPKPPEPNAPLKPRERFEPASAVAEEDAYALDDEPLAGAQRRSAPLVMAIAALLVVATLWALYGMLHTGRTASSTKQAPPVAAASPAPNPQRPIATHAASEGSGATAVALTTPGWRVVAYTYMHEAQAEHKADLMRQRYPQLAPGVFALHGKAPYLVTLGGVMNRADAFALRNRAVQMGLPRDTYAQNYR